MIATLSSAALSPASLLVHSIRSEWEQSHRPTATLLVLMLEYPLVSKLVPVCPSPSTLFFVSTATIHFSYRVHQVRMDPPRWLWRTSPCSVQLPPLPVSTPVTLSPAREPLSLLHRPKELPSPVPLDQPWPSSMLMTRSSKSGKERSVIQSCPVALNIHMFLYSVCSNLPTCS